LQFEGNPTGVIYGYLVALKQLRQQFASERLIHCWDHGKGLREQRFPYYKEKRRRNNSEENVRKQEILQPQIEKLKTDIIPRLGYKNNYMQVGYEADDVIASIIKSEPKEEFVIVTGDNDMYQLISEKVSVFHPAKPEMVDRKTLKRKYGIAVGYNYMIAKTIAGCPVDEIPGVKGVRIKTACKFFLAGKKSLPSTVERKIKEFLKTKQAANNLILVKLPYPGIKEFDLWEDERNERAYRQILSESGIKSLE